MECIGDYEELNGKPAMELLRTSLEATEFVMNKMVMGQNRRMIPETEEQNLRCEWYEAQSAMENTARAWLKAL